RGSPSSAFLGAADGSDFLRDVDPDRAPGDAAPAPDAARGAELIDPARELVSQPLPIARLGRRANAATMHVAMIEREARVPALHPFRVLAIEIRDVLDGGAEARRAYERAVRASEAPIRDVVPPRVVEVAVEEFLDSRRVERSAHLRRRVLNDTLGGLEIRLLRFAVGDARQDGGAFRARDLHEEAVVFPVEQLGQSKVETAGGFGPGAHGDAEAGTTGRAAVQRDDKRASAASGVAGIHRRPFQQDPVLDRDRV